MSVGELNFHIIRDRILKLLGRHSQELTADTKAAVEHYVAHDEYEMALEGLCLELVEGRLMNADDCDECLELGRLLGLDEETVLREDFWTMLEEECLRVDTDADNS